MGTRDLAELGIPRGPVDMRFRWFGEWIRVAPDASDLSVIEFLEEAEALDDNDVVGANRVTVKFLRAQIHPEDWPTVLRLARQHNQMSIDLLALGQTIVASVTAFPTSRLSDSSDGPPSTEPRSRGGSYSQDIAAAMAAAPRGDLKLMIYMAHQARKAAQRAG